jgi:hypothetical protein
MDQLGCHRTDFHYISFLSIFRKSVEKIQVSLTLSNPIFLSTSYSPALLCFGRERGWWITCNYPTVLKEKNIEKQRIQSALSVG